MIKFLIDNKRFDPKFSDMIAGQLLTPLTNYRNWSPDFYAIDNGAFSGFRETEFERLIDAARGVFGAMWVAAPDQVGDAERTLMAWRQWEPRIRRRGLPVAYVVQDGASMFELPEADAYFIGGSTSFKLSQDASDVVLMAKEMGKPVHMGRVNSLNRLTAAMQMGCDSIDGTGYSRFGDTHLANGIEHIRRHLSQPKLISAESRP